LFIAYYLINVELHKIFLLQLFLLKMNFFISLINFIINIISL